MSSESPPSPLNALLVVLSAPSGGGKTTVCERVLASNPGAARAITCTTRPPRPGERPGVDYHFMDPAQFEQRVAEGAFLEHATVYLNRYGILRSEVVDRLQRGQDVLLSVDVQGAATLTASAESDEVLRRALVTVFLTPPKLAILAERLTRRGQDSAESIERRLGMARHEFAQWSRFQYLIISDTIAADTERLRAIMTAEKLRRERVVPPRFED